MLLADQSLKHHAKNVSIDFKETRQMTWLPFHAVICLSLLHQNRLDCRMDCAFTIGLACSFIWNVVELLGTWCAAGRIWLCSHLIASVQQLHRGIWGAWANSNLELCTGWYQSIRTQVLAVVVMHTLTLPCTYWAENKLHDSLFHIIRWCGLAWFCVVWGCVWNVSWCDVMWCCLWCELQYSPASTIQGPQFQ